MAAGTVFGSVQGHRRSDCLRLGRSIRRHRGSGSTSGQRRNSVRRSRFSTPTTTAPRRRRSSRRHRRRTCRRRWRSPPPTISRSLRAAVGIPTSARQRRTAPWCSTCVSCQAESTTTPRAGGSRRRPRRSLWDLHQTLAAAGRGIPTGICPTVGAAGHALGGGLGAQSRHAGLLSDALTSATVVLPGGQAVTASAAENPDLFWALRGGGGGNFGVTTSLTFATFPICGRRRRQCPFPDGVVRAGPRRLAELVADRRPKQLGTGRQHHRRHGYALPHHGDLPCRIGQQRRGCRHHQPSECNRPAPTSRRSTIWI